MASAWGKSWGNAWGNTWGIRDIVTVEQGSTPGFNWSRLPRPRMRNRRDEFIAPEIQTVVDAVPIRKYTDATVYLDKIKKDIIALHGEAEQYRKRVEHAAEHEAVLKYIQECSDTIAVLRQEQIKIGQEIEESDIMFVASILASM